MKSTITKENYEQTEVSRGRRSVPWWIWVFAACFVLNFALVIYLDFAGPILGMDLSFTGSGAVVIRAYSPSPAAAADIQIGDQILSAGGRTIASDLDMNAVLFNLRVGQPTT